VEANDHDVEIASHSQCYVAQAAADAVRYVILIVSYLAKKSIVGVVDKFKLSATGRAKDRERSLVRDRRSCHRATPPNIIEAD